MAELFSMGEYGVYVWSVYGVALLMTVAIMFAPKIQHRNALKVLEKHLSNEVDD